MKKALIAAFGLLCFYTHVQASGDNELGTEVSLTGGPIHHGSRSIQMSGMSKRL